MLLKASAALLLAWIIGIAGLYDLGDLVHMFLLLAMMLGLLGVLKARDAAARDSRTHATKP